MLNRILSFLFSSTYTCSIYMRNLSEKSSSLTWSPYETLRHIFLKLSSNGTIIMVLVLLFIICVHMVIMFGRMYQMLTYRLKKICDILNKTDDPIGISPKRHVYTSIMSTSKETNALSSSFSFNSDDITYNVTI